MALVLRSFKLLLLTLVWWTAVPLSQTAHAAAAGVLADTDPLFTSPAQTSFRIGVAGTFNITAVGTPTPVITHTGGFLPPGLVFSTGADGSATISGAPEAGSSGTGQITLTATNSSAAVSQSLSITISEGAAIEGPSYARFVVGSASSHTIVARGDLPMTLSVAGGLPAGLVFQANSDGTATISGTPAVGTAGNYPLTITASNALGSDTRAFTLTVLNTQPSVGDRNYSAMYYSPASAGYAVNVTHQGNTVVGAWYTYGENGQPIWFLSVANRQADGSFAGDYTVQTGTPFDLISGSQAFATTVVAGSARFIFDPQGNLDFRFQPNQQPTELRRELTPFLFDPAAPVCSFTNQPRATASNYSDLWWQPSESGWGLTITHQGNSIFAAWYTYGTDGQPTWLVSLLDRQADGSYRGPLNRPNSGVFYIFTAAGDATTFPVPQVGNAQLRFVDGERGQFTYTVGNVTQVKSIERFVFGSVPQVCTATTGR